MTREKCLIILKDFTQTFEDVNFDFCGVDWWPLIKIQVAYQLHLLIINKPNAPDEQKKSLLLPYLSQKKIEFLKIRATQKINKIITTTNNSSDKIAVFTFNENKTIKTEKDELTNPFTTPFLEYFDKLNIEYDLFDINTFLQSNFKELKKYHYNDIVRRFNSDVFFQEKLNKICLFFQEKAVILSSLYKLLSNSIVDNEASFLCYSDFFKKNRYEKIVYYCYYNNSVMAINRAAKSLGVKTIEYQHSLISPFHFAYGGWSERIKNTESFFPSLIWCWDKNSANVAIEGFKYLLEYKAFIGGNVYISLYEKLENKKGDLLRVLITMQGIGLPDFIVNFIGESRDIEWYVRLHPRYPNDKELVENLKVLNPEFVEIEKSNKLPLPSLLEEMDYHITCFSGSALEAQMLGVQNIIWGKEGYESYKHLIDEGVYFFVDNELELRNIFKDKIMSKNIKDTLLVNKDIISENIKSVF